MDKEEKDIVFIDIKDNEETILKQRKIKKLEAENNILKSQIINLKKEIEKSKETELDLFDELALGFTELYNYVSFRIRQAFICF